MIKDLLIIVFYVDMRGLPANMLEKRLEYWETKYSMYFSKDILKRYEIKTLFIPGVESRVELLYPKVTKDTEEEKKLLTMVKEIELSEKPIPPPSQIIRDGEDPIKITHENIVKKQLKDDYKLTIKWWNKIKNKLK